MALLMRYLRKIFAMRFRESHPVNPITLPPFITSDMIAAEHRYRKEQSERECAYHAEMDALMRLRHFSSRCYTFPITIPYTSSQQSARIDGAEE